MDNKLFSRLTESMAQMNEMIDSEHVLSSKITADATNSINARSEAFRKALLHTQTKYADIIKALEDK
ncbi:hypothetical protein [Xenorhabdus hominickii]|uniref:Transcriptional regulator n=1 Tax=Xenorhabdus hominickii TaxID=351679 RepID=A0A2G0Q704_XENHO|nr:hypothetical protein [Xenorhabdus hominickii]AOM39277.1 hypothetical protein A9255_00780 [Xenorhabdus hominickii]PHM54983.1 transcriptional regulator [Xenorhabdus hominickii]